LLVALLLGLGHLSYGIYQCLLKLALQPFLFGFTGVQISPQLFLAPLVPSDKSLRSSTFRYSPHPPGEYLGHGYLLLGDIRGI